MAQEPSLLPDDAALAAYLDAALELNGIAVEPQWRENVLVQFKAVAGAARLAMELPLEDGAEPAPVFRP